MYLQGDGLRLSVYNFYASIKCNWWFLITLDDDDGGSDDDDDDDDDDDAT